MGTVETAARGPWFPAHSQDTTLAQNKRSLAHIAYLVTILFKGFVGLLEFTGGIIIAAFGPQQLNRLVLSWTNPELFEARQNEILQLLRHGVHELAQTKGYFVIFYLLVHGTLKMTITAVLLRGHGGWVFPFASAILVGFIAFFGYDMAHNWSNWVLGLTLFDTVTLALVLNEWRNWKTG
jgi:uncharacterized membrane protein